MHTKKNNGKKTIDCLRDHSFFFYHEAVRKSYPIFPFDTRARKEILQRFKIFMATVKSVDTKFTEQPSNLTI